eukprot:TRINITY_DN30121_c0_g1_i1.p1 TRINITY_DN30121_c0_g1~~TRINITY_DN30121_c0_g1_i1.p1  ORF type:complete len:319 (-),score=51.25 TRINITY_DN30121_c0_g1_i1:60-1016(-)
MKNGKNTAGRTTHTKSVGNLSREERASLKGQEFGIDLVPWTALGLSDPSVSKKKIQDYLMSYCCCDFLTSVGLIQGCEVKNKATAVDIYNKWLDEWVIVKNVQDIINPNYLKGEGGATMNDLPVDIIFLILLELDCLFDLVSARFVCKSWHSAFLTPKLWEPIYKFLVPNPDPKVLKEHNYNYRKLALDFILDMGIIRTNRGSASRLCRAISSGNKEEVISLLKKGVSPDHQGRKCYPLESAIHVCKENPHRNIPILVLLLQCGATFSPLFYPPHLQSPAIDIVLEKYVFDKDNSTPHTNLLNSWTVFVEKYKNHKLR